MAVIPQTKEAIIAKLFRDYDTNILGELSVEQVQRIHANIRVGGISIPQVEASIEYCCVSDTVDESELFDLLKEMDRRYYLLQDFRWEFTMLDLQNTNTITEEQAKWFVQAVHGKWFSRRKWERFLRTRAIPESGVYFSEIEVMLCNVQSVDDFLIEEEEDEKERIERANREAELQAKLQADRDKQKKQREIEEAQLAEIIRKETEERAKQSKLDENERLKRQKEKDDEEKKRKKQLEEEERGRKEAENRSKNKINEDDDVERDNKRLEELKKLREEKEREWKRDALDADKYELSYEKAKQEEEIANLEAEDAGNTARNAAHESERRDAEDRERRARLAARDNHNKRIRLNLKVAVKRRDRERLPGAVYDFKNAKLPDDDMDLAKAERLLREFQARDGLEKAMSSRELKELERAIAFIKRHGFEIELSHELLEANKILLQLRRLERIRAEILELKQSTVAEIRSYQKPPEIVHVVMTSTFLVLGHKESETAIWKNVQILVGKTGKDGLKRRCLGCNPIEIKPDDAKKASDLLANLDLDDVRDVSAGAATFYVWTIAMIEEMQVRLNALKKEEETQLANQSNSGITAAEIKK